MTDMSRRGGRLTELAGRSSPTWGFDIDDTHRDSYSLHHTLPFTFSITHTHAKDCNVNTVSY